ncbi:hypothetical protein [Alteriqipengyuania sp. 357]
MSTRKQAWITLALALVCLLFLAVSGLWRDIGAIAATAFVFLATTTILGFLLNGKKRG